MEEVTSCVCGKPRQQRSLMLHLCVGINCFMPANGETAVIPVSHNLPVTASVSLLKRQASAVCKYKAKQTVWSGCKPGQCYAEDRLLPMQHAPPPSLPPSTSVMDPKEQQSLSSLSLYSTSFWQLLERHWCQTVMALLFILYGEEHETKHFKS